MFITRATTERRYDSVRLASIDGHGRNVTTLRKDGHSNPSAVHYDSRGGINRDFTEAFKGDFYIEALSTGWYSIKTNKGTFRVAPETQVMYSTTGVTGVTVSIDFFFTLLAETREDAEWRKSLRRATR